MSIQKESPFFLSFGRDPVLPLNTLLGPKMRYLGMGPEYPPPVGHEKHV